MENKTRFFIFIFIFITYVRGCYSQDKSSFYSKHEYETAYKSNVNFGLFYNPFFPALSLNTSYDRFIDRKEKLALGIVYNYAWLGSEDDNGQSIGARLLYKFFSSGKFSVHGGVGGSYGDIRFFPFYQESFRFTYYLGGKYFFSDRFGALLEVSNYRVTEETFPILGLTYRFKKDK